MPSGFLGGRRKPPGRKKIFYESYLFENIPALIAVNTIQGVSLKVEEHSPLGFAAWTLLGLTGDIFFHRPAVTPLSDVERQALQIHEDFHKFRHDTGIFGHEFLPDIAPCPFNPFESGCRKFIEDHSLRLARYLACRRNPPPDPGPPPAPPTHRIFVSSLRFSGKLATGTLVGRSAANKHCRDLAASAGLGDAGWKAVISTKNSHARDFISVQYEVFNMKGELVAKDASEFWARLRTPVLYDERGRPPQIGGASVRAWTGTNADGTLRASQTCRSWNANLDRDCGSFGRADGTDSWLLNPSEATLGCLDSTNRLSIYCFK